MEYLGGLFDCQAPEYTQLDEFRRDLVFFGELIQSFIQRQKVICVDLLGINEEEFIELDFLFASAAFETFLLTGAFDQNSSHGFGGGFEEMPSTVPVLASAFHQADIRFVNEGRGLDRASR